MFEKDLLQKGKWMQWQYRQGTCKPMDISKRESLMMLPIVDDDDILIDIFDAYNH